MSSAGAVVAAQAAIAQAIRASGAIVRVEPSDFTTIIWKTENPLIVAAEGGFLKTSFQYLSAYKGLIFYTKSSIPLELGNRCELIKARSIWIPG
ncbi:MAG: hypothetical protein LAO21_01965 [Acidobacteriia bacterium]|nr:hypothetical protein [Terriglobia bacterium]